MTQVLPFLTLTFAISLGGFAFIVLVPGAQSPESVRGLPFWLLTIWGPSLAAIILAAREGALVSLFKRVIQYQTVPPLAWALVFLPLIILVGVLIFSQPAGTAKMETPGIGMMLALVAFNLVLGPLGEELGWRGTMQDALQRQMDWRLAALLVGVIWFAWHLPLWTIDSPQSAIPVLLFGAHCIAYSFLIGAAYVLSGGSILSAVLLHLTLNIAPGLVALMGQGDPAQWYRLTLAPYAIVAITVALLVTRI